MEERSCGESCDRRRGTARGAEREVLYRSHGAGNTTTINQLSKLRSLLVDTLCDEVDITKRTLSSKMSWWEVVYKVCAEAIEHKRTLRQSLMFSLSRSQDNVFYEPEGCNRENIYA